MRKLSALLIVKNERKHLPDVIDTLGFADEIIAVDSFSDDGTFEFLKDDPRVHCVQKQFVDYPSQRNYCMELAANDWVFFVDADERVPVKLAEEIQLLLKQDSLANGYQIYRQFYYKREKLRFSGLQTDKALRLFDRTKGQYRAEKLVHETLDLSQPVGILKNKLDHYFFDDYQTYRSKMITYGKMKGLELYQRGKKYQSAKQFFKTIYKFLNHYLIRLGILDGAKGFIVAKLNARSVWERYKELKRLSLSPKE
ncbi:glycosyltransferase family 2 protein [Gilvibacter sediminis]|uniref:glycosyltransferase family 2 protein n=1 Tax=Gilvibacter sediminis TaxID=379071 RepID=UPI002350B328|nr:glycosyltransferase family 2 protein [Gilvibacter sediminis]MDC7998871.1 glycosyltransferase family 2 protein [Gilvibacter sediminis]